MSASATIIVTIEVPVSSSWGDGCTMEQVKKQALDEALGSIRRNIGYRIIGDPLVKTIIHVEEKP